MIEINIAKEEREGHRWPLQFALRYGLPESVNEKLWFDLISNDHQEIAFLTSPTPTPAASPSQDHRSIHGRQHRSGMMRLQVHVYSGHAPPSADAICNFLEIALPNMTLEDLSLSICRRYSRLYPRHRLVMPSTRAVAVQTTLTMGLTRFHRPDHYAFTNSKIPSGTISISPTLCLTSSRINPQIGMIPLSE